MRDPMRKSPLSLQDIAEITGFQYVPQSTSGLTPLSELDTLVIFGALLIVSVALYIHLDIYPFLPFTLSPSAAYLLKILSILAIGVSGMRLLYLALLSLFFYVGRLWRRIFPRWPKTLCPNCRTRSSLKRYMQGKGCRKCGSMAVFCSQCGKPSSLLLFLTGSGCPYCQHRRIQVWWK